MVPFEMLASEANFPLARGKKSRKKVKEIEMSTTMDWL